MWECPSLPHAQHTILLAHFLPAFAFGPQFARGFSGNLANFRSRDGGLASFLIAKLASTLQLESVVTHTQSNCQRDDTSRGTMMTANEDLGSFARMAAPGEFRDTFLTG